MAGRERQRHAPRARESREPELGSGPAPSGVPGLSSGFGNRAVARLLQRDLLPWEEGKIGKYVSPFLPHAALTQILAEHAINNPIVTKCIQQYVYGRGSTLNLTEAEVRQQWVTADLFGGAFAKLKTARAELVAEASKRQSDQQAADPEAKQAGFTHPIATTGMTRHIDDDTGSALSHALGTCAMILTGEVSYAEAIGCTFTGTFKLKDRWDFDVLGLATHRGVKNELLTMIGRFGLAGQPFDVTTDPVSLEKNQRQDNSIVGE